MKPLALFFIITVVAGFSAWSQTVIITNDPDYETGEASAVLELKSESSGLLLPRMTREQRDGIHEPATGLLIFQLDENPGFYFNGGTPADPNWQTIGVLDIEVEAPLAGHLWDVDGNQYKWVQIGDQRWMASNLHVTHYRNGEPIAELANASEWISTTDGAFSYYDKLFTHSREFGALYNQHASEHPAGLCPEGWELPSHDDWLELITYLGGSADAAPGMKAARHWDSDPMHATNESGFAALPAGRRSSSNGMFVELRATASWWAAAGGEKTEASRVSLQASSNSIHIETAGSNEGLSVRCVRRM